MQEKTIEMDTLTLPFTIEEDDWQLELAKSQTQVKDIRQIRILTEAPEEAFVPAEVTEHDDTFTFTFTVDETLKKWEDLKDLHRNEKLRLLTNVAPLKKYLTTRVTFFLHPDNLVFNDNLTPFVIFRGIRDVVPPFEMTEQDFLKQLKCLSIALFSKKYTFDQLYNGALKDARETEYERNIADMTAIDALVEYLADSYQNEQAHMKKNMQVFPIKRFRLFKRLSIIMIITALLLVAPLVYYGFFKMPYQQHLLDAHEEYLATDYGAVISTLEDENADQLPQTVKYILASSYLRTGDLPDDEKESVKNNISLKSDENYLLYWIYNGRGSLDDALDKAKYMDDPQLIIHGLYEQIRGAKNDPDLSGSERDEKVKEVQSELEEYEEELGLDEDEEEEGSGSNSEGEDGDHPNSEEENDNQSEQDETGENPTDEEGTSSDDNDD